jgi:predicted dehydrogenase
MRKVRVGVVGTGFGRRVHIPAYRSCPSAEVVAVWSRREERARYAAGEFDIPYWFTDFQEMLRTSELDLISLVSPPHLHLSMYLEALKHNVHVLCEKPLAQNLAEALEMYFAGKDRSTISMVNLQLRFDPNRRKLKKMADDGYIGELRHVTIQEILDIYADTDSRLWDWWSEEAKGGGVVGAIGPHLVDTARWMFGDIAEVSAHLAASVTRRPVSKGRHLRPVETEDFASALLRFSNGGEGLIVMSVAAHLGTGFRLEAYGSEGTLVLDSFGHLLAARKGDDNLTDISDIPRNSRDRFPTHVGSLVNELVEAIVRGDTVAPEGGATFYDGLKVQEVVDAVRLSQKERRRVSIEEVTAHVNATGRPQPQDQGR